jgi:hypothetical protein
MHVYYINIYNCCIFLGLYFYSLLQVLSTTIQEYCNIIGRLPDIRRGILM